MSGDFRPTNQHVEVQKELEDQLRSLAGDLDGLLTQELGAFNETLRKKNVPNIISQP